MRVLGIVALALVPAAVAIELFAAPHLQYYDYSDWSGAWWIRVLLASVLPLSFTGLILFLRARATWRNPVFDPQRRRRWTVILSITLLDLYSIRREA